MTEKEQGSLSNIPSEKGRSWWQFGSPLIGVDIEGTINQLWSGIILGESKFNPERTCYDIADEYRKSGNSVEESAFNFIKWQAAKAAAVGFALGAPGFISVGVAIPGDFLACTYLQLRTVAVIGLLCGWDPSLDVMKTVGLYAMAAGSLADAVAGKSGKVGQALAKVAIDKLPRSALTRLNQTLGIRFATKYGSQGVVNLVDLVPVVGGTISGALNALITYQSGQVAYRVLKDGPASSESIVIDLDPDLVAQ